MQPTHQETFQQFCSNNEMSTFLSHPLMATFLLSYEIYKSRCMSWQAKMTMTVTQCHCGSMKDHFKSAMVNFSFFHQKSHCWPKVLFLTKITNWQFFRGSAWRGKLTRTWTTSKKSALYQFKYHSQMSIIKSQILTIKYQLSNVNYQNLKISNTKRS